MKPTKTKLILEPYLAQKECWPQSGEQVLAQFDAESVVVYQAYRPEIAAFAVEYQRFGGEHWRDRMSWIKPGFLWMMYRSDWASKPDQERVLAIRLRRADFDLFLSEAVAASYSTSEMPSHEAWQDAVSRSDVRLQWDPDHAPNGAKQERRAVQLGLRRSALRRYESSALLGIEDITRFVHEQARQPIESLLLPREEVYPV
jgi:hypothetical protein